MADEVDLANDLAEQALQAALQQVRAGAKLPPKGACYFCDEALTPETAPDGLRTHKRLFCDAECSQSWEREQRLRNRR